MIKHWYEKLTNELDSGVESFQDNFRRLKLLKFERSKTVSNFKTPARTMQMSYMYASKFPFQNFCILGNQAETKRHYRKQILFMIKHCYEKFANELDSGVKSFQDKPNA